MRTPVLLLLLLTFSAQGDDTTPTPAPEPWEVEVPRPVGPPPPNICKEILKGQPSATWATGKATVFLNAGWVFGGSAGPVQGAGAYFDRSRTGLKLASDGTCEIQTDLSRWALRLEVAYGAGVWSEFRSATALLGGSLRITNAFTLALVAGGQGHGVDTDNYGFALAAALRGSFDDWVSVSLRPIWNVYGNGSFGPGGLLPTSLLIEVAISKDFQKEHFR